LSAIFFETLFVRTRTNLGYFNVFSERMIYLDFYPTISDTDKQGKIYNFLEYKNKKPFFLDPINIKVGNPINETYLLVKNVVFKEKQILALRRERDTNTVILVEAKIENGELTYISKLRDEYFGDVSKMLIGNNLT
jgi:hypothetical protein